MITQVFRWLDSYRHFGAARAAALLILILIAGCEPTEEYEGDPQDIHLSADRVDFGVVPTGSAAIQTVRVHNAGDYALRFSRVPGVVHESEHEVFSLDATWTELDGELPGFETVEIPPRSFEVMTLSFEPQVEEFSCGYVTLYSNDTNEANRVLVLTGSSYLGEPQALVTPGALDFGWIPDGTAVEETVAIQNVGEVALEVASMELGVDSSSFEVVSWPAYPIQPGEEALGHVRFSSTGGNHQITILTVTMDGEPGLQHVVQLSANAPGHLQNTPPLVDVIEPAEPAEFFAYQTQRLRAWAFDSDQLDVGLYCTVESHRVGFVTHETSDPVSQEVQFDIDIDETILGAASGLHTLYVCCTDAHEETTCAATVVSVGQAFQAGDEDGDGYIPGIGDCDDGEPTTYPGALEQADGVDNDCDGTIDEGTDNVDDDGDGLSEAEGDCDDTDADTAPTAAEQADYIDNDCDGTIVEGTDYFDDDGDGFSEAMGDCDDGDPEVHRGAREICNGTDDDCDGERDEECFDDTPPLYVIDGIQAEVVVAQPDEEVDLCVEVVAGAEAALVYEWEGGGGTFVGDTEGACVTWEAPGACGSYTLNCKVTDTNSDQSLWAFLEIVVCGGHGDPAVPESDCSLTGDATASPSPVVLLALAALLLALRRR